MTTAKLDDLLVEPMARAIIAAAALINDPKIQDDVADKYGMTWVWAQRYAVGAIAAMRATLTANGLFVGPEVATEAMQFAMAEAFSENGGAGQMWGAGVAEWQRRGGA